MITQAPCYYTCIAASQVAEAVVQHLNEGLVLDIESIGIVSKTYQNDVEPLVAIQNFTEMMSEELINVKAETEYNPLYIPSSQDTVDEVFSVESPEKVEFTGMKSNPFAIRLDQITDARQNTIFESIVRYEEFELPTYSDVINTTWSIN
jgi:hypothetical protein